MDTTTTYTVETNATAGRAQLIAAETWGYTPGVSQGRTCEISTTDRAAAYDLSRALRARGCSARVIKSGR